MLIDISRPIHSRMAVYPNNPPVDITRVRDASEGISALSEISFGSHTGTHIDSLLHIDPNGQGIEKYDLTQYIGPCDVVEISGTDTISGSDIPPTTQERVLLKTTNSSGDSDTFDPSFVALNEDGAQEFIDRGVRLLGIDGPSIKKKGVSDKVHEMLLRNSIVIVEGLWLSAVVPGRYYLLCLPLSIPYTDGVPVRAILDSREHIGY